MGLVFFYAFWVFFIGFGGLLLGRGLETHSETLQLAGVVLFATMVLIPPVVLVMLGQLETPDESQRRR